eukprot:Rhum_TRINITY_DN15974_c0_g1::Rhum_TRINITY_DN15974_c0_g1_i1::g.162557::m.162557
MRPLLLLHSLRGSGCGGSSSLELSLLSQPQQQRQRRRCTRSSSTNSPRRVLTAPDLSLQRPRLAQRPPPTMPPAGVYLEQKQRHQQRPARTPPATAARDRRPPAESIASDQTLAAQLLASRRPLQKDQEYAKVEAYLRSVLFFVDEARESGRVAPAAETYLAALGLLEHAGVSVCRDVAAHYLRHCGSGGGGVRFAARFVEILKRQKQGGAAAVWLLKELGARSVPGLHALYGPALTCAVARPDDGVVQAVLRFVEGEVDGARRLRGDARLLSAAIKACATFETAVEVAERYGWKTTPRCAERCGAALMNAAMRSFDVATVARVDAMVADSKAAPPRDATYGNFKMAAYKNAQMYEEAVAVYEAMAVRDVHSHCTVLVCLAFLTRARGDDAHKQAAAAFEAAVEEMMSAPSTARGGGVAFRDHPFTNYAEVLRAHAPASAAEAAELQARYTSLGGRRPARSSRFAALCEEAAAPAPAPPQAQGEWQSSPPGPKPSRFHS